MNDEQCITQACSTKNTNKQHVKGHCAAKCSGCLSAVMMMMTMIPQCGLVFPPTPHYAYMLMLHLLVAGVYHQAHLFHHKDGQHTTYKRMANAVLCEQQLGPLMSSVYTVAGASSHSALLRGNCSAGWRT
jgi:hypothetical protein